MGMSISKMGWEEMSFNLLRSHSEPVNMNTVAIRDKPWCLATTSYKRATGKIDRQRATFQDTCPDCPHLPCHVPHHRRPNHWVGLTQPRTVRPIWIDLLDVKILESLFKGLDTSCSRCVGIGRSIEKAGFAKRETKRQRSARISGVQRSDSH